MGAGSQQYAKGFQFAPGSLYGLDVAGQIQAFHFRQQELRAETFRLGTHGFCQFRAAGVLHAGIIHHFMGNGDLTTEFFLFYNQSTVLGSCQIQRSSQSRRTAADHDYII